MKTRNLIYMLLLMGFILSSCREINIKTIINNDGSFTRIITVKGDSAEVLDLNLPYPVDSSWVQEIYRDTSDSTAYICTHTKYYKNDDLLNAETQNDTSWRSQIQRNVEISKRFMFFYSFITYRQVYKAANPFREDYHGYIDAEDLLWISGAKTALSIKDSIRSDSAEVSLDNYYKHVLVVEIIDALNKGLLQLNDPHLNTIDLTMYRDSIAANAISWSSGKYENSIDALITWTGISELARLHNIEPSIFEELEKKDDYADKVFFGEEYTLEMEMPGLITETNSTVMHGNTVSWEIGSMSFFFEDYEMTVESRVMNYWAFVLSGLVVLLLLIALIVKIFK